MSADVLSDVEMVDNLAQQLAESAAALMEQAGHLANDVDALKVRAQALPDPLLDLRIGKRQVIDCEWNATPMQELVACLEAGCLVLVMLGAAGKDKRTWRTVEVIDSDVKRCTVREFWAAEGETTVLQDPLKQIVRILYWPKVGA